MRKIISGLLVVFMCGLSGATFANIPPESSSNTTTTETAIVGKGKKKRAGKRKKNGRYKKRRGLFGKKNDCGCPKN